MPNTGATYPSTATDAGGPFAWTNPSNALTSNSTYTTASTSNDQVTNYLNLTGFGFSIPAGSTINGVVLEIGDFCASGTMTDSEVYILKGGVQTGTNKAAHAALNASLTNVSYGGASDLWGATLTYSDVNASNFGVQFRFTTSSISSRTASVDYGRVTVYYTTGGVASSAAAILGHL